MAGLMGPRVRLRPISCFGDVSTVREYRGPGPVPEGEPASGVSPRGCQATGRAPEAGRSGGRVPPVPPEVPRGSPPAALTPVVYYGLRAMLGQARPADAGTLPPGVSVTPGDGRAGEDSVGIEGAIR
jgi:hypothetical protein